MLQMAKQGTLFIKFSAFTCPFYHDGSTISACFSNQLDCWILRILPAYGQRNKYIFIFFSIFAANVFFFFVLFCFVLFTFIVIWLPLFSSPPNNMANKSFPYPKCCWLIAELFALLPREHFCRERGFCYLLSRLWFGKTKMFLSLFSFFQDCCFFDCSE